MDARIWLLALLTGGAEAALMLSAPQTLAVDMVWGRAAGFCLALAGTLAAYLTDLPRQAWGRRALLGAGIGMLVQACASAYAVAWSGMSAMATPTWLLAAAPVLGAIGALLGSFLEGVRMNFPARLNDRGTEEHA